MDRGRERRYDNDRTYGGESYRPSERDPPSSRLTHRGPRSPVRRERTPPSYSQRYAPDVDRRRSRSPQHSSRADTSYRRPRSPPRRGYSPRRDDRARSPLPRARHHSRSPVRAASPRSYRRDPSPYDRKPRSPPPKARRPASPRDRYDRRGYSPPRDSRPRAREPYEGRPPPRSPSPPPRRQEYVSRAQSPVSSRRSSPPIHPDRLVQTNSRPRSPEVRDRRPAAPQRNGDYRETPSGPKATYPSKPRSLHQDHAYLSPPTQDQEMQDAANYDSYPARAPPSQPSSAYRAEEARAARTSSNTYNAQPREPPSGPASSRPSPMSAHNRPGGNSILSAPTKPRGSGPFTRDPRDSPHGGPPPQRGGRPPPAAPYHGQRSQYDARSPPSERPPPAHRPAYGGPSSSYDTQNFAPGFRPNNSSSTTYPRTQRFTNHLASIPAVVPGGKAQPPVDPAAVRKLSQLEEDADKLRKQIDEKQKEKRANLREWETRERESRRDGLRSELAEAQLEAFNGEVIGGNAF